jgi:hypothetical protein
MTVRTKLSTGAALVAAAAFLAPVAQAQAEHPDNRSFRGPGGVALEQSSRIVRPDDRAEPRGPGGAIVQAQSTTVVRPDDRAEARGPGAFAQEQPSTIVRPDDRAEPRGPGAIEQPTIVVSRTSGGFDWGDAFVGAMGGLGMALLLTGALFLLLGQRTRTRVA